MDYLKHNLIPFFFVLYSIIICIRVTKFSIKNGFGVYYYNAFFWLVLTSINVCSFVYRIIINSNDLVQYFLGGVYYLAMGLYFIYYFYRSSVFSLRIGFFLSFVFVLSMVLGGILANSNYFQILSLIVLVLFYFLGINGFVSIINEESLEKTAISEKPLFWVSLGLLIFSLTFVLREFPRPYFNNSDSELYIYYKEILKNVVFFVNIVVWYFFYVAVQKHTKLYSKTLK